MEQLRPAPYRHDGPGMEQIDQQGEPPGPLVPALIDGLQKGKEKDHAEGQGQIHTVMALDAQVMEQQSLRRHGGHREQEACPGGPAAQTHICRPQQYKERNKKQAVSGVGAEEKQPVVARFQNGDLGNQSVIAVPAHTDQVEQTGQGQGGGHAHPGQQPGQGYPQQQGGEVPQMIEGAVGQQSLDPSPAGGAAGVPVQRQVKGDGQAVEQQGLAPEAAQGAPLARRQEMAADHEEEGDGYPAEDAGQYKIPQRGDGVQGRGVDTHHHKGGHQTEAVQRRSVQAGTHGVSLQTVRIKPPTLSPEIWQRPSGRGRSMASWRQGR